MKKHVLLVSLLTLSTSALNAAGISIIEQSVSGFKTGYAGAVTSLDEPSTVYFNPAGLSRAPGKQLMAGVHVLSPKAVYTDEGSTIGGQKIKPTTPENNKDVAETLYIPNAYGSYQINDRVTFGLGAYSPFGLGIKHKKGWQGRYHATNNDMLTVNINPSLAYKASEELTFGVGLSAQYVKAELCSDIDFGGIAFSRGLGSGYQQADGDVKVTGDGTGYGFNFGMLWEPDSSTRFGASYRSSIATALKGDAKFKRSVVGDDLNRRTGVFANSKVETEVTFPDSAIFGFYKKFEPQWALMGDMQYMNWKRFKDLRVQFGNTIQPDEVTLLEWKRAWRYALGLHYYVNQSVTLGIGGGIDKSPVPDAHRSPRIPDADRKFWTGGVSFNATNWLSFDLGGGKIIFKSPKINLTSDTKGNLKGHFNSSAWIANFGLRVRL